MANTNLICIFSDASVPTQGHVEIYASQPIANGARQTAPVFEATYKLDPEYGNVVIPDLPQRKAGEDWFYVLNVYPVTHDCSKTGAMQFRFYIPEGEATAGTLTYFINNYSAW